MHRLYPRFRHVTGVTRNRHRPGWAGSAELGSAAQDRHENMCEAGWIRSSDMPSGRASPPLASSPNAQFSNGQFSNLLTAFGTERAMAALVAARESDLSQIPLVAASPAANNAAVVVAAATAAQTTAAASAMATIVVGGSAAILIPTGVAGAVEHPPAGPAGPPPPTCPADVSAAAMARAQV